MKLTKEILGIGRAVHNGRSDHHHICNNDCYGKIYHWLELDIPKYKKLTTYPILEENGVHQTYKEMIDKDLNKDDVVIMGYDDNKYCKLVIYNGNVPVFSIVDYPTTLVWVRDVLTR